MSNFCFFPTQTRAEILEMVVKKIKALQQKNTELESRLKDLPSPTEGGTHYIYTYSTEMVSRL